tara:strand:+ start:357 stop:1340 length:984 start_codon:yes stop_codon:yes gene_type:complete
MFSPKDFKAYIVEEATTGTVPTLTSGNVCLQLDVDDVNYPSISPNQVLGVRTGRGKVLHTSDVFQDNEFKSTEVSLSGTFHKDAQHLMLMQNVCGGAMGAVADVTVGATATGVGGKYGTTEGDKTFTLILASPDTTDGYNIVMPGCQCTSFTLNADMGTDGGVYKWSATISTGKNVVTNNTDAESITAYGTTFATLSALTVSYVYAIATPVINSFSVTVESPAVYTGFTSTGFAAFNRGEEISVTAEVAAKYDATTRPLLNTFNTQTGGIAANALTLTQGTPTDGTITIPAGILTNAALDTSDIVMMNLGIKATSGGSVALITFDFA